MTSFWDKAKQKYLEHCKYRAIHLARCNTDYIINHNQEHKEQLAQAERGCNTHHCPEADKRITKEVEIKQKHAIVPPVERPKRLNR